MDAFRLMLPIILFVYLIALAVGRARFRLAEHERLVIFRLGRPAKMRGPGIVWIIPFFESGVRLNTADPFEARRIADYQEQLKQASERRSQRKP